MPPSHNGNVANLNPNQTLWTIAVDVDRGDPSCTIFIHRLLPDWVRWRYVSVHGDRIADLDLDTSVLVVTRWIRPDSAFVQWARRYPHPVGLILMADETNAQDPSVYGAFDFVLRHYYFRQLALGPDIVVHALGNRTCGTMSPATTTPPPIYWLMLLGRGLGNLDSGHGPATYWPARRRRRPVIWIGSLRGDRAEMVEVMRAAFPDGDLQVEDSFGGRVGPFEYGHERAADAIFGLIPFGNHPETHRLAEILDHGCIPVMLASDYRTASFRPVPGIVASNWTDAAIQMKQILDDDDDDRLDQLQESVIQWWNQMRFCMKTDLDLILKEALH